MKAKEGFTNFFSQFALLHLFLFTLQRFYCEIRHRRQFFVITRQIKNQITFHQWVDKQHVSQWLIYFTLSSCCRNRKLARRNTSRSRFRYLKIRTAIIWHGAIFSDSSRTVPAYFNTYLVIVRAFSMTKCNVQNDDCNYSIQNRQRSLFWTLIFGLNYLQMKVSIIRWVLCFDKCVQCRSRSRWTVNTYQWMGLVVVSYYSSPILSADKNNFQYWISTYWTERCSWLVYACNALNRYALAETKNVNESTDIHRHHRRCDWSILCHFCCCWYSIHYYCLPLHIVRPLRGLQNTATINSTHLFSDITHKNGVV